MTTYQQIILNYIQSEYQMSFESDMLTLDTSLVEQGIIDSMGIYRLVGFLEEEFDIDIDPGDVMLRNFKNVEAIADLVAQKTTA